MLKACNAKIRVQNTKLTLFIYYCPAHPSFFEIRNIKQVFLQANSFNLLKPLYQGSFRTLKHFRGDYWFAPLHMVGSERHTT
jgi:hypothetical protein